MTDMERWEDQRTPALAIVARGDQIEAASPVDWIVRSQSDPSKAYRVSVRRDRWTCECAHFHDAGRSKAFFPIPGWWFFIASLPAGAMRARVKIYVSEMRKVAPPHK